MELCCAQPSKVIILRSLRIITPKKLDALVHPSSGIHGPRQSTGEDRSARGRYFWSAASA